jgi:hypothetical protein
VANEDDVRRIALSLPGTTEYRHAGSGDFRVKGKGFTRIRYEADGSLVEPVVDLAEKEALLASEPAIFFTTPFYEGRATVLVRLPAIGVEELRELLTESWCMKASARMRQVLVDRDGHPTT